MKGTPRPTRIDKRVVKALLDIVDHSLLVVTRAIGHNTDASSHLNDLMFVVVTNCRSSVHRQQMNHALLVFVGYRSLRNHLDGALSAEATVADWIQLSNLQMPSTEQPPTLSTNPTA